MTNSKDTQDFLRTTRHTLRTTRRGPKPWRVVFLYRMLIATPFGSPGILTGIALIVPQNAVYQSRKAKDPNF